MGSVSLTVPGTSSPVGPVSQAERISSLDAVRGFALLGILLMNIVGFGMNFAAYDDPTTTGGSTGINLWIWIVNHVLAEGKMRCLFSMVFGAGIILLTRRIEKRGIPPADIYYRRLLWLMLFGIVHAYLLWAGDILYWYALLGLALYPFRHLKPRALLIIGGVLVVAQAGVSIGKSYGIREMIKTAQEAQVAEKAGKKLTEDQTDAKKEWEEMHKLMKPDQAALEKDAKGWRGNLLSVIKTRGKIVGSYIHPATYYSPGNWDMWSMMFIGMGLFGLGVFSGERSYGFYAKLVTICYGIGIPLNSLTAWIIVKSNFDIPTRVLWGSTYDLGRLTLALGHMGVIVMLCKAGLLRWLTARLAAVGQMAFSNYIMHSVICSTIFTGFGFGLYGKLERYQVYYVVFAIWIFQLIVSPIWLAHHRMGPLEWCWRSLTYWKKQPFRVRQEVAVPVTPPSLAEVGPQVGEAGAD